MLYSCGNKKENTATKEEPYDMYVASEMSNLMNQMYAYNASLKDTIVMGKKPNHFPSFFMQIDTAELSSFHKRDASFNSFSQLFITAEKEIFDTTATTSLTERYNAAINLCVSCHQDRCTGPIPKIKRLYIK